MSDYLAAVAEALNAKQLVVPRRARRKRATTTEPSDPMQPVYDAMSERQFQAEVVRALRSRGWTVWVVPNMRLTTAGLPDLLAIHDGWEALLAIELKRERGGKVSPAQRVSLGILMHIPGVIVWLLRPSEWPARLAWIDSEQARLTRAASSAAGQDGRE